MHVVYVYICVCVLFLTFFLLKDWKLTSEINTIEEREKEKNKMNSQQGETSRNENDEIII